uniref:Dolichyl-diphosphooligosaccharide--protein glycosyltransferase subunit MAGT1 n=1 Tax=Caenorhabditis tropicalis TaxID=1561998 RepID=A0A1I7ULR8_9PELO
MRLLAAVLVVLIAVVASQQTLDEKVQNLVDLTARQSIVKFNLDKWKNLVRMQPRNYSMIVMFTALSPGVNCPICKPAYEEFMIVANSHRYTSAESERRKLFFGIVDYEDAPQIFQQMNLNTAPILYHFGPKLSGKKKPEQMDFQRQGFDADAIGRFVADQSEVHVRVIRPPNYTAPVVIALFVSLLLGMLYMKRNSLDFLLNRTMWGFVCLAITFIFMSGQMWNHIRGPPFMINNPQTKEPSFIHGSTQFQLIAETYIVAVLYALVAVGFICVNEAADQTKEKKAAAGKKTNSLLALINVPANTLAIVGLVLICVFFSFLLSVFRSKYRGYPYSFLFA